MNAIANLEAEIHALSSKINSLQMRHDALIPPGGTKPSDDDDEEMATIRGEREQARLERSKLVARVQEMKKDATHTLRFTLVDGETTTFEKAYEPIRLLLADLREAGVVTDWEWPR